jgi:hypothetical protein
MVAPPREWLGAEAGALIQVRFPKDDCLVLAA